MKFRIRFADQIVGIFILIAIAALVGILILMGINQRWFAQNYYFESRFESGSGINVGTEITLKGFEIGKVDKISLTEKNNVDIVFYIYDTYYEKVKPNSVLELASSTFGLGGGLRFHPGKNEREPLPENSFIPSLDFEEGQRLVQNGLVAMPKSDDAISSIVSKIGPLLDQLDATLVSVQTLLGSANSAIAGKNEGPLGDILVDVNTMIRDINTMVQNLNIRLAAVFDNVDQITGNIEATTEAMRDPTGIVKTVLDPKGSLAMFLDDNNVLFEQVEDVLERVNDTIDQVHEFTAFINTATPQISGLLEKSREALDQGKDVLEGLRNNPLLRGGISEQKEQASTFQSYRDEDF